jgi:23S rRNA (cytidine1920-2'-O)/16S rRNA (cytidine1409-2'-O)-methyltransferase
MKRMRRAIRHCAAFARGRQIGYTTAMTKPDRQRADLVLVARGFFETRARAQAAIAAGCVSVEGATITKASDKIATSAAIVATAPHPWVSRAGLKLVAALEASGIDPRGQHCLDLGASTGGFTEVLLVHEAAHVTSVDVGRAQFHASLIGHPKVNLLEGTDARALTADHFETKPKLVVADLSFTGLAKVLPVPLALVADTADLITLIKPQFEAGGPSRIGRGGIVDSALAEEIVVEVAAVLSGMAGFQQRGLIESPIQGGDGNREFLWWGRRG